MAIVEAINRKQYGKLILYQQFDLADLCQKCLLKKLIQNSSHKVLTHVIDHSLDLEIVDSEGWKPIHYFIRYGTPTIQAYLIDKNIDLEHANNLGRKPIHFAIKHGSSSVINQLIAKNVDLNCADREKWCPIHLACRYNTPDTINKLIDKGVCLDCETQEKWKPIHLILRYHDDVDLIKKMIDVAEIDLECEDEANWRPIHYAIRYSDDEVITHLIKKQVCLQCKTNGGKNVKDFAKKFGSKEIIALCSST